MKMIADQLEQKGHEVFLPQRDGLELMRIRPAMIEQGFKIKKVDEVLSRAIFALDVYQLLVVADALVANLNGRVPDEGTVAEAAMAWHAGKVVVLYKADGRSFFNGGENPLVYGLGHFRLVSDPMALPAAIDAELQRKHARGLNDTLSLGRRVASLLKSKPERLMEFLMSKGRDRDTP
jgi:nucleoside 2-deoxyribosyltransferase